jgi:hypothetical protein
MLGVEIEFGNNWTLKETSSYKPTKAKTPARTLGFQNSVVARGGIEPPTQGSYKSEGSMKILHP